MSQNTLNTKMTAIADEIRELSGTTEAMGLVDMKMHVWEANAEVDYQAGLITQIVSVLEGKAAGSGSGNSSAYETYTVRNNLLCEVYIGGTCISPGEHVLFPVSQVGTMMISCLIKDTSISLDVYLNGIKSQLSMRTTSFSLSGSETTGDIPSNGLLNCFNWMILFSSSLVSGDVIDIGQSN